MQLKSFNQEKRNKKILIVVLGFLVLCTILLAIYSYSLYEKADEGTVADGTAKFPDANEVSYVTTHNTDVKSVADALDDLYDKLD